MRVSHRKRNGVEEDSTTSRRAFLPTGSLYKMKDPDNQQRRPSDSLLVLGILVMISLIFLTEYVVPACNEEPSNLLASEHLADPLAFNRRQTILQDAVVQDKKKTGAASPAATTSQRTSFPVIDIISIGSNTRKSYQTTQERTFGRHRSIRQFHPLTEHNDTDQACLQQPGKELPQLVFDICHRKSTYRPLALMKRHFAPRKWLLEKHSNPTGWLCAQKRPLDALQSVVLSNKLYELPDYFMIIDDDTWLHMDRIIDELESKHPPEQHHVVAGCLIRSPKDENFCFQWGGFGLIWTKAVLERLLIPLHCDEENLKLSDKHETSDFESNAEFAKYACQRIALNLVGEQHFFEPGMSLLDLIYQYSAQQPYTNASEWLPTATFCMHSDTTLAYFLQYYHVGQHAGDVNMPHLYANNPLERMAGFHGSTKIKVSNETVRPPIYESFEQCLHLSDATCPVDSYICHYVTPKLMEDRFRKALEDHKEHFRPLSGNKGVA